MALYYPAASADDATQNGFTASSNQGVVSVANTSQQIDGNRYTGFRFPNIVLNKGDAIASAKLKFPYLTYATGGTAVLSGVTLYGEYAASAAQYTSTSYSITSRIKTKIAINGKSLPATSSFWANTGADVTGIVQDIVNHRDWITGNALNFIFWGDVDWATLNNQTHNPPNQGYINTATYDIGNSAYRPTLEITTLAGSIINTPLTVAQDTGLSYEGSWTNLNNAKVEDGSFATANIASSGTQSKTIRFSNFGFNIPTISNINGIRVDIKKQGNSAYDYGIYINKAGVDVGFDHSDNLTWTPTLKWLNYGDQNDTWGVNWTPAEINSSGFGFSLKVGNVTGGGTASVDSARVTVFYDNTSLGYYNVKQSFIRSGTDMSGNGNGIVGTSGNSSNEKQQLWEQVTNTTGSSINLSRMTFRLGALLTTVGGGKGDSGTTYDRTGTNYTVRLYTSSSNASSGTSPIQTWYGALQNSYLESYDFKLDSAITWANNSTLYWVIRASGTAGVNEPDFMVYGGSNWSSLTDDDSKQTTYDMAADSGTIPTSSKSVSMFYEAFEPQPVVVANSAYPVGDSNMAVTGARVYYTSAIINADSNLAASGYMIGFGSANVSGDSKMIADRIHMDGGSMMTVDGTIDPLQITKSYIHKIYDKNFNYMGVWNDVVSEFGYSQEVNSGGAAITVTLARNSDSLTTFYDSIGTDDDDTLLTDDDNEIAAETNTLNSIGPGTTVDLNLNVKIYEFSSLTEDIIGDLVFTGFISKYTSKYGSTETTDVSIFSYGADLDNWLLTDDEGNTRVPYLSVDPSDIIKDTLDRFQADGGLIGYDNGVPDETEVITNLITNPSFETNATGWTTNSGIGTRITSGGNTGSAYYQLQNSSGGTMSYTTSNLSIGTTYKLSMFLKRPAGGTVNVSGAHNSSTVFDLNISPPPVWTRYDIQFNATATSPLYLSIAIIGSDNQVHVDSVMLTSGNVLYDYFDGSTVDAVPETTFAWTGTANASTSTRTTILTSQGASIEDTNTVVTYAFNLNTELEVIKKTIELAPTDWFFYTDLATNDLHFHPRPSSPDHLFYLGKHILGLNLERSMEGITNDLVLTGGKQDKIVTDNFFGSNGTPLENHTGELNATWSKHPAANTGGMVIYNNRVRQTSGTSVVYLAGGITPSNDYAITADIRVITNAGDIGIIGRADPTVLTFYMGIITPGNTAELYKCINGTFTQIDSQAFTITTGTTYTLELIMEGARIALRVDGDTLCDVQDTSIVTGNYSGFRTGGATVTDTTGYHFNNFNIKNTGAAGPAIFKRYIDTDSINTYRRGLARIQDNRVSVESSADIIALTEIARQREPRYRSQIIVSNGAYPIRSIKLGQLVGFRNFDNYVDSVTMQVVRIDYKPDSVTLQLDTLLPSVPKRLEDIRRNLNQADVEDNPDAPILDA